MKNNMQLVRVQDAAFPALPALQQLYESCFPEVERRDFNQLLQLLSQPDMYLHALLVDDKPAGLAVHWQLDQFTYLEHLAIEPEYRGCGYGKAIVRWLLEQPPPKLVLEVELPTCETTRKRIAFYEQLGLTLQNAFDYQQPPYQRHGQPVPLCLMAAPALASAEEFNRVSSCIRERVYERFYG
ncbi:GNAT family N-acetyltransferase [Botryobacter ruber]|uniref:GNAT family N-acetyltransferase n=1 Tax=Botryobacter ruber TaxID=2171629 RepID=UPI000E0B21DD|nr:GNAT family N-acetyltransferase [Botryobacter ruber]